MTHRFRLPLRPLIIPLALWLMAAQGGGSVGAQQPPDAEEQFERLKEEALKRQEDGDWRQDKIKEGQLAQVEVARAPAPQKLNTKGPAAAETQLVARIWAERARPVKKAGPADEQAADKEAGEWEPTDEMVDLTKHVWKPGERFYLRVETAVPVQLAVYQMVEMGQNVESVLVMPQLDRPETFRTILPNECYRSPLLMLDKDTRTERIGFVLVRADVGLLPINGGPLDQKLEVFVETVTQVVVRSAGGGAGQAGAPLAVAEAEASARSTVDLLEDYGKRIYSKTKGGDFTEEQLETRKQTKLTLAPRPKPRPKPRPNGNVPNEAARVVLGPSAIGYLELDLKKTP